MFGLRKTEINFNISKGFY